MNITFLIGNGFDLNCGLKSSYSDMYEGYCEEKETDSEVIKKFKKLIKQNNYETWSCFEWAMAKNINMFKTENDFIECLIDFKRYLVTYLSEEKEKFLKKYNNNSVRVEVYKEILNSISNFYKDITNNISNIINRQMSLSNNLNYTFISFNYTCILDEIFKPFTSPIKKYNSKYINIHGSLNNNDIILGIDNEKQLELKSFNLSNDGKISFIKPIFNEQFDTNRVTDANNAILQSDIICVYGMSLGESDLTWKKLIIKWLDSCLSEDNKHLFIYDHKNCKQNIFFKDQQLIEERKTKEKFIIKKLKIEETNDKLRKYFNKIHMPFKNIFNVKKIIETANSKNKNVANKLKEDIENIKLNL